MKSEQAHSGAHLVVLWGPCWPTWGGDLGLHQVAKQQPQNNNTGQSTSNLHMVVLSPSEWIGGGSVPDSPS